MYTRSLDDITKLLKQRMSLWSTTTSLRQKKHSIRRTWIPNRWVTKRTVLLCTTVSHPRSTHSIRSYYLWWGETDCITVHLYLYSAARQYKKTYRKYFWTLHWQLLKRNEGEEWTLNTEKLKQGKILCKEKSEVNVEEWTLKKKMTVFHDWY